MFGNAPWPCGAGSGKNTDDGTTPGVTNDSVQIADGDDAGYAGSPGLNHEMTDAMKVMIAKCNALGGINGRQITAEYHDASCPSFAQGKHMFVALPNPAAESSAGQYTESAKLSPEGVKNAVALVAGFTATQDSRDKAVAVSVGFGWHWNSTTIEYNPTCEADWTRFVKQIQDAKAGVVYFSGGRLPNLQLFMRSAKGNGSTFPGSAMPIRTPSRART